MLSMIVAIAENNVIGKDNKLIWHLPEDLKRFKRITDGKTIIMGRKTFESLGRVLPNRKHIILCNDAEMNIDDENVKVIESIDELKEYVDAKEECFVIGGATIYRLLMPLSEKLYITKIHESFEGDVFFPEIDNNIWKEISKEKGKRDEKNNLNYEYVIYTKK